MRLSDFSYFLAKPLITLMNLWCFDEARPPTDLRNSTFLGVGIRIRDTTFLETEKAHLNNGETNELLLGRLALYLQIFFVFEIRVECM
jgi:hypothetical protein